MEHKEHVDDAHSWVLPLSPRWHSRRVPCQRRFSFPADLPWLANCPRASTEDLWFKKIWDIWTSDPRINLTILVGIVCGEGRGGKTYLVNSTDRRTLRIMAPRWLELVRHWLILALTIALIPGERLPLLKVTWPTGTSRIVDPNFSTLSIHVWLQKWDNVVLGAWRHMRQRVSPRLVIEVWKQEHYRYARPTYVLWAIEQYSPREPLEFVYTWLWQFGAWHIPRALRYSAIVYQ